MGIETSDINDVDYIVYPNPVQDELTIDFFVLNVTTLSVSIFNLVGEKIFFEDLSNSGKTASFKIKGFSKLDAGIYLMELNLNGKIYQKKLVKL